jgi:hypothetical protein
MRVRLFLLLLYTPFDIDKYIDYELGRLIACLGDEAGARKHFELVLSGKLSVHFLWSFVFLIAR